MTNNERDELRGMLASITAQRLALEAETPTEPAESPCEDEAPEGCAPGGGARETPRGRPGARGPRARAPRHMT